MPDKDVMDRLRAMIRDMERKAGLDDSAPRFPPVPEMGIAPRRGALREIEPSSVEVADQERFRLYRAIYREGAAPEFKRVPEVAFESFRSLEPSLLGLDDWLFLDIETTGLIGAATVAFLVGLGEWTRDGFAVTQLFLRDRQDEEFMLDELKRLMAGRRVLVTFNGKAFDIPVLSGRFIMSGMRPPDPPRVHLDLLSLVRNMGKRREYGQSLKEAIRRFTGAMRDGDISGHLIPALYFVYERDGDISVLEPVVKHNRLDIIDMACLAWVAGHVLSGEVDAGDRTALGGAGKLHLRKGNLDLARRCLETSIRGSTGCAGPDAVASLRLLGHVLRKQGDWRGAGEAWERVVASGDARDEDYLWLARCYELASGDIRKSLDVVARAAAHHEAAGEELPPALMKRRRRLEKALRPRTVIPPPLSS